jgi:hypothetical protein
METTKSKVADVSEPLAETDDHNGVPLDEKLIAASTGSLDDIEKFLVDPEAVSPPITKPVLLHLRVGKPPKQDFVRVRPEPEFRCVANVLKDEASRDQYYLVAPQLVPGLAALVTRVQIMLAVTRLGAPFLWPLKLPNDGGLLDPCSETAIEVAARACTKWTRMTYNQARRAYDVVEALSDEPQPAWPDVTLTEALRVGFRGKTIDSADHPIVKRVSGL